MAFEDLDLTMYEREQVAVELLYPVIPENMLAARLQAAKFLNGGNEFSEKQLDEDGDEVEQTEEIPDAPFRAYSMEKDSRWIFAAFRQTHGVNLEREDLHFWEFLTLFAGLGEETFFCKLVGARIAVHKGTATKEITEWARSLGDIFYIEQPDNSTPEEKDLKAEFDRLVALGKQKERAKKK
jgi:hypothetical protein